MEKKKGFGESLEAFFAGKGFYIVLFLCVAIIGVSAWAMLAGNGTDVENSDSITLAGEQPERLISQPSAPAEPAALPEPEPETQPVAALEPDEPAAETVPETPAAPASAPAADFFVWPVSGEIENAYSMTALVYSRTMRDWRTHDGIDIACELGTQVKAVSSGTVCAVEDDDLFGTTVRIDHGAGLVSVYSNLAELPTVKFGDVVTPGQVIGAVGDTALCEPGEVTHLHFAMTQDGESIDPAEKLP